MQDRSSKNKRRTHDVNRLSRSIIDLVTGNPIVADPSSIVPAKNPAAVALGRLGGLKGGKARSEKLSAEEKREIAKKGAQARWGKRHSD
jgi:hypothetical protein